MLTMHLQISFLVLGLIGKLKGGRICRCRFDLGLFGGDGAVLRMGLGHAFTTGHEYSNIQWTRPTRINIANVIHLVPKDRTEKR